MVMVPTWTGKLKEYFPVKEKSENIEHTAKVREFYPKYLNGKVREFYPVLIFSTIFN